MTKPGVGNRLFRELAELKDQAIAESHFEGRRRNLGRISLGTVIAHWRGDNAANVWLRETGVKVDEFALFESRSTPNSAVYLFEADDEEEVLHLTLFNMNLHPKQGFINVYKNLTSIDSTSIDIYRAIFSRGRERRLGLALPTYEELAILRNELERGASGAYALKGMR